MENADNVKKTSFAAKMAKKAYERTVKKNATRIANIQKFFPEWKPQFVYISDQNSRNIVMNDNEKMIFLTQIKQKFIDYLEDELSINTAVLKSYEDK